MVVVASARWESYRTIPPDWKEAGRPLMVVSVGSAIIFAKPSSRKAFSTPKKALVPLTMPKENVLALALLVATIGDHGAVGFAGVGGMTGVLLTALDNKPAGPEVMTLGPVIFEKSKPNWRSLVRETSMIFTCNSTC